MPVFMHGIAAVDKSEHVRKGADNCARMEKENKISYGLKKTKYISQLKQEEKEK